MPPTIPAETSYSETELSWIESEPRVLPSDQDSFWGQARKVFADYLQTNVVNRLDTYWNNLSPITCDEDDLANWEETLGIPVNNAQPIEYRRALVQIRLHRGAFTRTFRRQIVQLFINAVEGSPIIFFTDDGIPFGDDGIVFGSGDFDATAVYEIVEDVPGYSYDVSILNTIDIDEVGLYRELKRATPAPIDDNFTITRVSSL